MTPWLTGLDTMILHDLYGIRSIAGTYFFIGVSEFATLYTLAAFSACSCLYFLLRKQYAYAVGLASTMALTGLVILYVKSAVALARPDMYYQAYVENGMTFPSGHAAGSMAFYGFLAYVARREFSLDTSRFIILIVILLIGLIGFSRLYLGVHYFSDVAGGYALGALCNVAGIGICRLMNSTRLLANK